MSLISGDLCVGIDIGATKTLAGVVDREGTIHRRLTQPTALGVVSDLTQQVAAMIEQVSAGLVEPIRAVGVGVPGQVDHRRDIVAAAPNLRIREIPLRAALAEMAALPVFLDNDGNCAMLAEWRHGAAMGCTDAVMLTVGTGLGGGVVCGGQLLRGSFGGAAELGHMVIERDGHPCQGECPGVGHIEWYASGSAIGREGERQAALHPDSALGREARNGRPITGALVSELAHDGDHGCRLAIAEVGRSLGAGMVTLVNIFNPERLVVGGGAVAAGELLLGPARREVEEHAMPSLGAAVEIVPARFGADAGLLGAATLAFEELPG